jgi:hypothetical protein
MELDDLAERVEMLERGGGAATRAGKARPAKNGKHDGGDEAEEEEES